MSKKTPSQDFNYKFEHHWGGEDTWYTKGKRWANKQKFPINHLALGFFEWLWQIWVDGRVELEMSSVDEQAEQIKKQWKEEDEQPKPEIVEDGVFGEEGWSISITNQVVERGTEEFDRSMGIGSNEIRLEEDGR